MKKKVLFINLSELWSEHYRFLSRMSKNLSNFQPTQKSEGSFFNVRVLFNRLHNRLQHVIKKKQIKLFQY